MEVISMKENEFVNENVLVVFVDTSAIDPMFNDYSNMEHQFMALKKHIEANKLILLTHEVSVREMEKHIKEEIEKQLDKLTGVQKSKELALLRSHKQYKFLFDSFDSDAVVLDTVKALKSKFEEIGILTLKTGPISVKKLLDDYFSSAPPFGLKGKKAEFPDAIMLQSLTKAVGNDHKIHIVAKDGDWERACKSNKNLILHKNLAELLDYINKDNAASSSVKRFLSSQNTVSLINSKLKKIISDVDFKVDGLTYDRKGLAEGYEYDEIEFVEASDISYKIHTIEDIECASEPDNAAIKAIVTIVGSSNVALNCSYFNEEKSAWDSETHEYVWKVYESIEEVHEFLFPVRLTISGTCDQQLAIDEYKLVLTEELTQLNSATLIERNYIVDEYEDSGFHVEKILSCPHCKKDIKLDLISDATDCVSSSERQMGIEREYRIDVVGNCTSCNGEYQVTGSVWEYPENCCNYEQDIVISKKV